VLKDGKQLKIWLADLRIARNVGFAGQEANAILRFATEQRQVFLEAWLEAWNDYFGH
jgi:hypothetical protein